MNKRELGKTGLMVSEYCLGAMYFAWRNTREVSFERLDQYTGIGGNFIDTANIYSIHLEPMLDTSSTKDYYTKNLSDFTDGMSERLIGDWMQEKGNRHDLVIATKVGFPYPGCSYGTTAKQIRDECEKSLIRLKTDYIDLFYLHTDDRSVPMEESLEALTKLVKEGKVRYIGASNFAAWRLAKAAELSERYGFARYCAIQQRHSYLRQKSGWDFGGPSAQMPTNEELFDFVRNDGMTLLAYSPLLNGAYVRLDRGLSAQYIGADSDARLAVLEDVAAETGATKNQLVYYWMLHSTPAAIPLVACSTSSQFEEAIGALSLDLTTEQFERLDKARA